jgi:predicted nuclease with TOPRIM domain
VTTKQERRITRLNVVNDEIREIEAAYKKARERLYRLEQERALLQRMISIEYVPCDATRGGT